MDIAEKRRPQDGRIKTAFGDKSVELRVSTLPVAFGEKIVIRIFDPDALLVDLPDLGFDGRDLDDMAALDRRAARPHPHHRPHGQRQDHHAVHDAEDARRSTTSTSPLSKTRSKWSPSSSTRWRCNRRSASTFRARCAQSCARTPTSSWWAKSATRETAEMAVQAALTGHLVLSTLHTNDSPAPSLAWSTSAWRHFSSPRRSSASWRSDWCGASARECKKSAPLTENEQGAARHHRGRGADVCDSSRGHGVRALPQHGLLRTRRHLRGTRRDPGACGGDRCQPPPKTNYGK